MVVVDLSSVVVDELVDVVLTVVSDLSSTHHEAAENGNDASPGSPCSSPGPPNYPASFHSYPIYATEETDRAEDRGDPGQSETGVRR